MKKLFIATVIFSWTLFGAGAFAGECPPLNGTYLCPLKDGYTVRITFKLKEDSPYFSVKHYNDTSGGSLDESHRLGKESNDWGTFEKSCTDNALVSTYSPPNYYGEQPFFTLSHRLDRTRNLVFTCKTFGSKGKKVTYKATCPPAAGRLGTVGERNYRPEWEDYKCGFASLLGDGPLDWQRL